MPVPVKKRTRAPVVRETIQKRFSGHFIENPTRGALPLRNRPRRRGRPRPRILRWAEAREEERLENDDEA